MKVLWLDDLRDPTQSHWAALIQRHTSLGSVFWVKSFYEFINHIQTFGLPDVIWFDHDLGQEAMNEAINKDFKDFDYSKIEEKTGYDCVRWLIDYCEENNLPLPVYYFQTANPVGRENMQSLLENYDNHKRSQISGQ